MNGILLIQKPTGITSRDVVDAIGRKFNTKKVGHTGTLDPFADGLMMITMEKATKAGTFIENLDKRYEATIILGQQTDTGDLTGKVINTSEIHELYEQFVVDTLESFLGSQTQIPPMYSAIKKDGVPYELISKAMPVIESEVNNILGQVVDFSLSMDTDGKNINARIVYEDQEWNLEMCSGMEKFISGLAIRVALINICGLPRPNFLVIDEGFGTLDADNLSSLFMMMQYLKTQFDFIWMISHLEQMRDIVDGLIEIKKESGFSKINF